MDNKDKLRQEIDALRDFFQFHDMRSRSHEHRMVFEETAYMFQSNMQMGMWSFMFLTFIPMMLLGSFFKDAQWLQWVDLALMGMSLICGSLFLVFLNPTPKKNNILARCKLLFSSWSVKDVERAIEDKDFKHPSIRKIDKHLTKLHPLSTQDIQEHHQVFSNLPSDHECFQIWSKLMTSPAESPVRQIDVENLYRMQQKIKELSLLEPPIPQTVSIENASTQNVSDEQLKERISCAVDTVMRDQK